MRGAVLSVGAANRLPDRAPSLWRRGVLRAIRPFGLLIGATLVLAGVPLASGAVAAGATRAVAPPAPEYTQVTFRDVGPNTPHYAAIEQLAAFGIIDGYPGGVFRPNQIITRAEFAKLLDTALGLRVVARQLENVSRTYGLRGLNAYKRLPDVPAGRWYTGFVYVAAAKGVLEGYPDGTFRPDEAIRYDEAVTAVVRALGYLPPPSLGHGWPSDYLLKAATIPDAAGKDALLDGLSDQPDQPLKRGDAARLVANMLYSDPAFDFVRGGDLSAVQTVSRPVDLTQSAQLAMTLYYPGAEPFGPPLKRCYANVIAGTAGTDPTLHPHQVRIESLGGDACLAAALSPPSVPQTYTVAPGFALVGGKSLHDLIGCQVSFALNRYGQIAFIQDLTPPRDVLSDVALSSQPTTVTRDGIRHLAPGIARIGGHPVAPGAIVVPSRGGSQEATLVLNPDGRVVALLRG